MSTSTLDKPLLWSYREAAEVLGQTGSNDYKAVALLVRALKIVPKAMGNNRKGLDRADLDKLATALGVELPAKAN